MPPWSLLPRILKDTPGFALHHNVITLLPPEPLRGPLSPRLGHQCTFQTLKEKEKQRSKHKDRGGPHLSRGQDQIPTCWKSGASSKAVILNSWRNAGRCSRTRPALGSRWLRLDTTSSRALSRLLASAGQSCPASGSFPMRWLFESGNRNTGVSASAPVLLMNIHG